AATLMLIGFCIDACAPPPKPIRRPGWEPATDVTTLLQGGTASLGHIKTLTAAARVTIADEQTTQSLSASFQYLPPELLRIDVRGPLFRHVLTAVFDADTLWSLAEGRLSRFAARRGLVDLLDLDLMGDDPRIALLGLMDSTRTGDVVDVEYPRADRAVAVIREAPGGQRRLWVDILSGWIVAEERIDASGQRRWRRELSDHARVSDSEIFLPRHVRIESRGRSLDIQYDEWRVNRDLSRANLFKGLEH
ncbi:MAG: hypothetical protein HN559_23750, partial [Gemmatimonadetes bacterium]|nr:hypothetical protein [Gemmatimonadota bacterium]